MRKALGVIKRGFDGLATIILAIPILTCAVERRAAPASEGFFSFWAQLLAGAPGLPGVFLRRAFYRHTLERCGRRVFVGYGALFTHRTAIVEEDVYVGPYAVIGSVRLQRGCLVGTRASILSGGLLHERTPEGGWTPYRPDSLRRVEIGEDVWIGEGAIVMAEIKRGAMIAAGSVVSAPVVGGIVVAGNPGRFARHLDAVAEKS